MDAGCSGRWMGWDMQHKYVCSYHTYTPLLKRMQLTYTVIGKYIDPLKNMYLYHCITFQPLVVLRYMFL